MQSGADVGSSDDQDSEASDEHCDWDTEVASVFKVFDADESGTISRRQLKPAIRHLTSELWTLVGCRGQASFAFSC